MVLPLNNVCVFVSFLFHYAFFLFSINFVKVEQTVLFCLCRIVLPLCARFLSTIQITELVSGGYVTHTKHPAQNSLGYNKIDSNWMTAV